MHTTDESHLLRISLLFDEKPALWQAQRKYEEHEKHEAPEVRADEEMDIGV